MKQPMEQHKISISYECAKELMMKRIQETQCSSSQLNKTHKALTRNLQKRHKWFSIITHPKMQIEA